MLSKMNANMNLNRNFNFRYDLYFCYDNISLYVKYNILSLNKDMLINPCLDTPTKKNQSRFYVKIHVIKHDMDPNSYLS